MRCVRTSRYDHCQHCRCLGWRKLRNFSRQYAGSLHWLPCGSFPSSALLYAYICIIRLRRCTCCYYDQGTVDPSKRCFVCWSPDVHFGLCEPLVLLPDYHQQRPDPLLDCRAPRVRYCDLQDYQQLPKPPCWLCIDHKRLLLPLWRCPRLTALCLLWHRLVCR